MKMLTKQQILLLHSQMILQFGGSDGIRDEAMLVLLDINGIELKYDDEDLIDIILKIAAGKEDERALNAWVRSHIL